MAVMERSHGWHQRDGSLFRTQAVDGATQCGDRADDHGTSRHLGSISGGQGGSGPDLGGGETNHIKPDAWPPSHRRMNVFADARSIAQKAPPRGDSDS
jgi:hypothetical protein